MPGQLFDAVYLCSATVLPEYRRKGLARAAAVAALTEMRSQFPINALYFWKFSEEGAFLADAIGRQLGLPVFCKESVAH